MWQNIKKIKEIAQNFGLMRSIMSLGKDTKILGTNSIYFLVNMGGAKICLLYFLYSTYMYYRLYCTYNSACDF